MDEAGSTVRIMFFDWCSALNSIQPLLWRDKLRAMQVNTPLVSWITDELSGRPQFVRLRKCMLDHRSSWDLSLSLSGCRGLIPDVWIWILVLQEIQPLLLSPWWRGGHVTQ
ncbi:hypothetical protein L3Q82_021145, partial [Scortum barcoo]